jgi:hypothetical protein
LPPRPPIGTEKREKRYLEAVRDKMVKLHAYGDAKPPACQQLWQEITGSLKAGELLGNFTTEELQAIIGLKMKTTSTGVIDHCSRD